MNKRLAVSDPKRGEHQRSLSHLPDGSGDLDEMTTTQKIYLPVAQLDAEHRAAFAELQKAVNAKDDKAIIRASEKITKVEGLQQLAHEAVRKYALKKVGS